MCARGRSAAAPARSPAPPSPGSAAIVSPSAPGLSLASGRGAETRVPPRLHPPAQSPGEGISPRLRRRLAPRRLGEPRGPPAGRALGAGGSPPERWMKRPGLGSDRGCSDSDRTATRCIVSSGVSRFLSYAFACGRWWWGLFLFLCSGRRDPPLFPAGNL